MSISKEMWIRLYRDLLREAQLFNSYSYREFFKRRIRENFRAQKNETNPEIAKKLYSKAQTELGVIRRQVIIGDLYPAANKSLIEVLAEQKKH